MSADRQGYGRRPEVAIDEPRGNGVELHVPPRRDQSLPEYGRHVRALISHQQLTVGPGPVPEEADRTPSPAHRRLVEEGQSHEEPRLFDGDPRHRALARLVPPRQAERGPHERGGVARAARSDHAAQCSRVPPMCSGQRRRSCRAHRAERSVAGGSHEPTGRQAPTPTPSTGPASIARAPHSSDSSIAGPSARRRCSSGTRPPSAKLGTTVTSRTIRPRPSGLDRTPWRPSIGCRACGWRTGDRQPRRTDLGTRVSAYMSPSPRKIGW